MLDTNIVFYDSNIEYVNGLSQYLVERYNNYHFIYFTDSNKFMDFCKSFDDKAIFIVAEYCMNKDIEAFMKGEVLLLVDDDDVLSIDNYNVIYRYQAVEIMISQVLNYYAEKVELNHNRKYILKNDCKIIGIYSPVNRCGKTNLSLNLSKRLNEKVLIINLEEFSGIMDILHIESEYNISDLMYFFLKNADNLPIKLDAVVKECGNFHILPPIDNPEDLYDIDIGIWRDFIISIRDIGKYQYIILDISNVMQHFVKIFEICTYVFMPYVDEKNALKKMEKCNNYIQQKTDQSIVEKIYTINISNKSDDDVTKYVLKCMED